MTRSGGYWREAATIIIAAQASKTPHTSEKPATPAVKTSTQNSGVSRVLQHQNNTLHANPAEFKCDYKVLMLKRNKKSKFLPDNYVFPGGTVSDADFDPGWRDLIAASGSSFSDTVKTLKNRRTPIAMFQDRPVSEIPAEIAFRICAIRECFEECGLLIVRSLNGGRCELLSSEHLNAPNWRKRIHSNPGDFLALCRAHRFVPDIWSLYEWCNWLTPVMKTVTQPPKKAHRFDTLFYVYCTNKGIPPARVDNREAVTAQWCSPVELLHQHDRGEISMITPQVYELSRMCNFGSVEALETFACVREAEGVERWLPVVLVCQDRAMLLHPGDEFYPERLDLEGFHPPLTTDQTFQAVQQSPGPKHRVYMGVGQGHHMVCDVPQTCGHVSPVGTVKSKL